VRTSRRGDVQRVADMLEAITRIQGWSSEGVPQGMYQAAVLHELMVIGEAASRLSDAFMEAHPGVPWKDVIGQRVQLAHHYWDTQWARIQQTVAEDIPALKAELQQAVQD
jgi:uncharacterized protein with HEPN domain